MPRRLRDLPLLVLLSGVAALAMLVPAAHAAALGDWGVARAFGYSALLVGVIAALVGIATAANRPGDAAAGHLLALLGAFVVLPLVLAFPFYEAVGNATLFATWWEMVSALTTTGATLFDPAALSPSIHLWRALVGWLGGLLMLVAAMAILAPMDLGGFEVLTVGIGQGAPSQRLVDPGGRMMRATRAVLPIYGGLTLVLWIALIGAGDAPLVAASHAMGTLSTSGITPVGGPDAAASSLRGEALIAPFLLLALSRRLTPGAGDVLHRPESGRARVRAILQDPELRLGLAIIGGVSLLLFLRHWAGSIETRATGESFAPFEALWGTLFTVLSFLTTTGFVSAEWGASRTWSGLGSPGLILAGLAIIGGGIATTAGGVKLLRMRALLMHGQRETEKLVHPNSLGGSGVEARRLRRQGARIAWVAFMLFAVSIAATMLFLTFFGTGFQEALIFAVAAFSTTGPLAEVAGDLPLVWAGLTGVEQAILAVAMVVGRLETLAVIALFNPALWRA